jgi:hypothetical protein
MCGCFRLAGCEGTAVGVYRRLWGCDSRVTDGDELSPGPVLLEPPAGVRQGKNPSDASRWMISEGCSRSVDMLRLPSSCTDWPSAGIMASSRCRHLHEQTRDRSRPQGRRARGEIAAPLDNHPPHRPRSGAGDSGSGPVRRCPVASLRPTSRAGRCENIAPRSRQSRAAGSRGGGRTAGQPSALFDVPDN